MRRVHRALACVVLLAATAALVGAEDASSSDATDAVVEVVVETLRAGADPVSAVAAVQRDHAARPGFVAASAARIVGPAPRLLRTVTWASLAAAEDASLAADGSGASQSLASVVDAGLRATLYARRLRVHVYDAAPAGHLEVTIFRTRPGTTREQHLARFDAAETDFAGASGLLGHALYLAPDGQWVHEVRWRSEADFAATGKALMKTTGVGGWIRSLDYGRFSVLRGDRLGT